MWKVNAVLFVQVEIRVVYCQLNVAVDVFVLLCDEECGVVYRYAMYAFQSRQSVGGYRRLGVAACDV